MNRSLAAILMALLAAGCAGQAPKADPFFGRTRIAPPATGAGGACGGINSPAPVVGGAPGCAPPQVNMPPAQPGGAGGFAGVDTVERLSIGRPASFEFAACV